MQNLNIKNVSSSKVQRPRRAVGSALKTLSTPLVASRGSAVSGRLDDLVRFEDDLAAKPMVRIELETEGAVPTTNYANFWVGQQLMLGTVVDESNNKISGYVQEQIDSEVRVRVEFANGDEMIFDLRSS